MTRGWSEDRKREAAEALSATHAALDRDPSDALALATEGFVYCHLLKDLDTARKRCEEAVDANPSHALGWLYLGTVNAFKGEGEAAVDATRRAMELSPLDPQRYYFESLARDGRAFCEPIRECRKTCALVIDAPSHAPLYVAGPDDRARLAGANG